MTCLPRIAVGTVQPTADYHAILWALMDVLERHGSHVQPFLYQARFVARNGATTITGQSYRHLDSWLMSPRECQELVDHGMQSSDLALVGGTYDVARGDDEGGGSLDTLCQWLDLPRIVVVDVTQLQGCRLPTRPEKIDGILLDRTSCYSHACNLWTSLEALWGVPVLGALDEEPALRAVVDALPSGAQPSAQLCGALGAALESRLDLRRLLKLAVREFPEIPCCHLFPTVRQRLPLNVAVAYDEAFNCYFPDTLDLLESHGARIHVFSPLRTDTLPCNTDVVYLGCGHAERFAETLANNHCLKQAICEHAERGGRVYAEGSGLAYLCRSMILPNGRQSLMAGILPAVARLNPAASPVQPVEIQLRRGSWFGDTTLPLRGYLNGCWELEAVGPLESLALAPEHALDVVGKRNVVASRVHVNFAAQPNLLRSFFQPYQPSTISLVP